MVHHHSPHEMPSLHIYIYIYVVLYLNIHEYPMFSDPNLSLDLHNGGKRSKKQSIFGDRAMLKYSQSVMEFLPVGRRYPPVN